jgi:hypothetical protein
VEIGMIGLATYAEIVFYFFLKWGQKLFCKLLIKKKRIAQLINENR